MMEDTSKKSGGHEEQKSGEKTLSRRSSAAEMNVSFEAQVSVFEELHAADKAESTTSDGTRTKKQQQTNQKLSIYFSFMFFYSGVTPGLTLLCFLFFFIFFIFFVSTLVESRFKSFETSKKF